MLRTSVALLVVTVIGASACATAPADTDEVPSGSTTTESPIETPVVVEVPDLTGLPVSAARSALEDRGLALAVLPAADDEAIVMAQEPVFGTQVDPGSTVTVDARTTSTCNAPDPLAPGSGEVIITVLFECGGDAIAPTEGVGVARIVPDSQRAAERIEWTLRSLLAGPTADERALGFTSAFDATTAAALNAVTLADGALVVDFNDAIVVNNMSTATGMVFFQAELKRNVFQHPEVDTVEFRFNGRCDAWSALFESDGCRIVTRAEWKVELTEWAQLRHESTLPEGARSALGAYWASLPSAPDLAHRVTDAWQGEPPTEEANPAAAAVEVWCVEAEISSDDAAIDGTRMVWIVTRRDQETTWSAALLASLSSTWPYEACAASP
jgi:hypothetical protein